MSEQKETTEKKPQKAKPTPKDRAFPSAGKSVEREMKATSAGGQPAKITFTAPLTKAHASGAIYGRAGAAMGSMRPSRKT